MKTLQERTETITASINVLESLRESGKVLVEVYATEHESENSSSAGIRLTRQQARELGDELIRLADELYFKSLREDLLKGSPADAMAVIVAKSQEDFENGRFCDARDLLSRRKGMK